MIGLILTILAAEVFGVSGQVLFKKSVNALDKPNLRSHRSYFTFLGKVLQRREVWIGFLCIALGVSVWLIALAQAPLSLVFPIDSLQYVITLVAAGVILRENIDRMRVLGTLLIIGGILLVAVS